jgi:hypothetical protein
VHNAQFLLFIVKMDQSKKFRELKTQITRARKHRLKVMSHRTQQSRKEITKILNLQSERLKK